MHKQCVRPMPGRKVRKPDGTVVPPEGCVVTWSSYWLRREKDGDIERIDTPESTAPAVEPPATPASVTQEDNTTTGKPKGKEKV